MLVLGQLILMEEAVRYLSLLAMESVGSQEKFHYQVVQLYIILVVKFHCCQVLQHI